MRIHNSLCSRDYFMRFECDDLEIRLVNSEENMRTLLSKQLCYVANVAKWIRAQ